MTKWLLILLVVVLAYGLTLKMYIWQDDNAIMFKLQHLSEGVGNLGTGIYDRNSAYRFVIVPLIPLYYIFGIEPTGYFFAGLLVFFLASISVYFLIKTLTNKADIALASAAIFSSGYIGAESLWRIFNSIHTSITIILICCSLYFYHRFIKEDNRNLLIFFYFLSLLLFAVTMEIGYVRAHGIFIPILFLEILFNSSLLSPAKLFPFFSLYGYWYIFGNTNTQHISLLIDRIFRNFEFEVLKIPLQTLQNIFIPDSIHFPFIIFIPVLLFFLLKFRSRILWFAIIFMVANYLTYFFIYQDAVLSTTNRYLTTSSVGFALFAGFILRKIFNRDRLYVISCLFLITLHLFYLNKTQLEFIKNNSIPTKFFYNDLKKNLPNISKNSAIYFDTKEDFVSQEQFKNFFGVGSMPDSTAVAIHYDIDRYDIFLPQSFSELISLVKEKKVSLDSVYTFYYNSRVGLSNTTNQFRENLVSDKKIEVKDLNNPNLDSISPKIINFDIETNVNFITSGSIYEKDFSKYLSYFESRRIYLSSVKAESETDWQSYKIENVVDNNELTSWMANRVNWHYKRKESLTLNLNSLKNIGAVKLIFGPVDKVATEYYYECSINNLDWEKWGKIYYQPKNHSEIKIDKLETKKCKFIRMVILDTLLHDSPEIQEIEAIEETYKDLDFQKAKKIFQNPFIFAKTIEDQNKLKKFFAENGIDIQICFWSDKYESLNEHMCQKISVRIGKASFTVLMPSSGTKLQKINFLLLPNIKTTIYNMTARNASLNELIHEDKFF